MMKVKLLESRVKPCGLSSCSIAADVLNLIPHIGWNRFLALILSDWEWLLGFFFIIGLFFWLFAFATNIIFLIMKSILSENFPRIQMYKKYSWNYGDDDATILFFLIIVNGNAVIVMFCVVN